MGCCALNDDVCRELVAWLRRAMYRPAALPLPTPLPRQSRLLLHHAAEPRDEPEGLKTLGVLWVGVRFVGHPARRRITAWTAS